MNKHLVKWIQMKQKRGRNSRDIVRFRFFGDTDPRVVMLYADCIKNGKMVIANFK